MDEGQTIEFVARFPLMWRLGAAIGILGVLLLLFSHTDTPRGLNVLYSLLLVGALLGGMDVLTYRLRLDNGVLHLRTIFGTEVQRRCDEIVELVFRRNENVTIRFLDWRNTSFLRKAKEFVLKELDSSRHVFSIPQQTVDLKSAGELLLKSVSPGVRVTRLR